ncbi:GNAT family N-acetyltransferase [Thioclava sp. BHET1]|nr:GNAT family N-acetyltransferase [Thioclava sp. BHET1]
MTADTSPLSAHGEIRFTPFTTDHLDGAWHLSQQVGWPHRLEDWALTLSASQGVVALEDGQVVGTALCSAFGAVAALNMIIVDARMRGRGLGRKLMEQVIALAGARELRLVATADGLPLYQKLGFQARGNILQYQGQIRPYTPELPVARASAGDLARIGEMDLAASGCTRTALLRQIAETGEVVMTEAGFAMIRPFGRGRVLGPIVAATPATARALIAAAATTHADSFLRIDLPEASGLAPFVADLGLAHVGGGVAMDTATAPRAPSPFTTYALASQALG